MVSHPYAYVGDGDHTVPNPIPPPHFRKMMPSGMAFLRNARTVGDAGPYTPHPSASLIVGDGDHTVPKSNFTTASIEDGICTVLYGRIIERGTAYGTVF